MPMTTEHQRQSAQSATAALKDGGAEGIRTPDPHNAIVVLYQLSYDPIQKRRDKVRITMLFVKI
jgi:hypothetical protein